MAQVVFVLGGVKSGKSRLGMQCLESLTDQPLLLATARHTDEEMSARIARHIADRPDHWDCIETPIELPQILQQHDRPLLIDCMGVWLTNLLVEQPDQLHNQIDKLMGALASRTADTVIISNESSLGVIGANSLTRRFIDEQGLLNQRIASTADHVAMTIAGQPLWLKGQFIY
mgnify:CR=1 FL=1